ncbi:hypothetical protein IFM89_034952 [Coptis chinensis]|uniref:Prenyltransferase alpha-alpha toroid domain-containing protein n=1 Tax=Coptis chinensis TaxID=261450 RepID=A0A835M1L8_9MAGN|nr:hypothetical protein IFM89_034952 [Coptis chinensis]
MSNSRVTITQREQWMVESKVSEIYQLFSSFPHHAQTLMLDVQRDEHMEYLNKGLKQLGPSFCVLDANRPWLCYWILHSMALLGESVDCDLENGAVDFLSCCQMPHLATTYAAVNSLLTLGGERALSSINRWMHNAGEMDVRACYTAISVASILNILDDELVQNVGNFILRCQTYEGGIAGEPGSEAHGGYTFCGLATMILIDEADRLDLPSLLDWVVFRQGVECGFQGRANKLVDGCYSFWQGGVFALIQRLPSVAGQHLKLNVGEGETRGSTQNVGSFNVSDLEEGSGSLNTYDKNYSDIGFSYIKRPAESGPLFHSIALQQYILLCSQVYPFVLKCINCLILSCGLAHESGAAVSQFVLPGKYGSVSFATSPKT